jgi:hypothetical protein
MKITVDYCKKMVDGLKKKVTKIHQFLLITEDEDEDKNKDKK